MLYIALGCIGFMLLYIFDINKVKGIHKSLNIFFAIGVFLLAFSTFKLLSDDYKNFDLALPLSLVLYLLSGVFLISMLYALFIALPFQKTYMEIEKDNKVIDKGMYALCRHPGVLWFFFFYLFLWLASGKMIIMWAGIIWTIMDIIHVYVQERWLFPKNLRGYDQYQKRVPFLIPNSRSIKQFILTIK